MTSDGLPVAFRAFVWPVSCPLYREQLKRLQIGLDLGAQNRRTGNRFFEFEREGIMKMPTLLEWYRILRDQYQSTMFQAVRFALWLAR
jgi:hypothetical protein